MSCSEFNIGILSVSLGSSYGVIFDSSQVSFVSASANARAGFIPRAGSPVAHMVSASASVGSISCTVKLNPLVNSDAGTSINTRGVKSALVSADASVSIGEVVFAGFLKAYSYSQGKERGDISISFTIAT